MVFLFLDDDIFSIWHIFQSNMFIVMINLFLYYRNASSEWLFVYMCVNINFVIAASASYYYYYISAGKKSEISSLWFMKYYLFGVNTQDLLISIQKLLPKNKGHAYIFHIIFAYMYTFSQRIDWITEIMATTTIT